MTKITMMKHLNTTDADNLSMRKYFFLTLLFFLVVGFSYSAPSREPDRIESVPGEDRQRLLAAAESLLGTPYRHAGLDRRGLDCSGFVHLSFHEGLNYSVPRTTEDLYNWVNRIPAAELQPGDLVFFVTVGNRVSHVGIYTGNGRFIHSASEGPRTGVIYSHLDESYWRRTFLGAGRILPLDSSSKQLEPSGSTNVNTSDSTVSSGWAGSGFYSGFGAAWTWGSLFRESTSGFRGINAQVMAGYKMDIFLIGIQFKPGLDVAIEAVYLPFFFFLGTNTINVFGGPVYIIGLSERSGWQWELGLLAAFPPVIKDSGAVSIYGELSLNPGRFGDAWNFRVSTGVRYFLKI